MQIYYIVLHGKQDENGEKSDIVIDGLKKYNRNMLILKTIVVILSIFIISIWGNFIVERIKAGIQLKEDYEKRQYIFDIIDKAYSNLDEITNSNNYTLAQETISISYDFNCVYDYLKKEMFYKDGYFKEVSTNDLGSIRQGIDIDLNYINYGVETKDETFYIQLNDNNYINGSIVTSGAKYESAHAILELYRKEDLLEYKNFEIKEEKIGEKTYYIISEIENKNDGVYCREIWIDKNNMLLFKDTYGKVGCQKTEMKFTLSVNNVKDEDVRVKFAGENEKLQELDKFFEKINNGEFKDNYVEVIKWSNNNFEAQIPFDYYVKPNKKIIMPKEAIEIIDNKYDIKEGYGYESKGIIFDQNGDAYYSYRQSKSLGKENTFVQNIFVSIFGDIMKTNDIDTDLKSGDLVIL